MEIRPVVQPTPLATGSEAAGQQLAAGPAVVGDLLAVAPQEAQLAIEGSAISTDSSIAAVLEQAGLPTDRPHREAARTLLAEAGSIEPAAVRDLMRQAPADRPAAAYLLARGLPVTPETLALVRDRAATATFGAQLGDSLSEAMRQLDAPPELGALVLASRADAAALSQALETLVRVFTPPEAELARHVARDRTVRPGGAPGGAPVDGPGPDSAAATLASGAPVDAERLAQRLASNLVVAIARALELQAGQEDPDRTGAAGPGPSARQQAGLAGAAGTPGTPGGGPVPDHSALADLQGRIRYQQLVDAAHTGGALGGQEVRLPLVFGKSRGELMVQRWKGTAREPQGHARVVVALDMANLGPLSVDVMYARGHLNGHVTVADEATADYLKRRISELEASLTGLGVGVGHLGVATPTDGGQTASSGAHFDLRL